MFREERESYEKKKEEERKNSLFILIALSFCSNNHVANNFYFILS
jgi:hypothetical protein